MNEIDYFKRASAHFLTKELTEDEFEKAVEEDNVPVWDVFENYEYIDLFAVIELLAKDFKKVYEQGVKEGAK